MLLIALKILGYFIVVFIACRIAIAFYVGHSKDHLTPAALQEKRIVCGIVAIVAALLLTFR